MDNQDAPRKLKLKLFAEQCLERLTNKEPGYTDFQAMQDIYIQAAKLSGNNVDAFMDDLFDVLIGQTSIFNNKIGYDFYAVGNQNLISLETRKKMNFRGFKDTGFPTPFRDGGNQVNHCTAYFVMAYQYGNTIANISVIVHELDSNYGKFKKGKFNQLEFNLPDFSSGFFASKCSYLVSSGMMTPLQFSTQMHILYKDPRIVDIILKSARTLPIKTQANFINQE